MSDYQEAAETVRKALTSLAQWEEVPAREALYTLTLLIETYRNELQRLTELQYVSDGDIRRIRELLGEE